MDLLILDAEETATELEADADDGVAAIEPPSTKEKTDILDRLIEQTNDDEVDPETAGDITQLLAQWRDGDNDARDQLIPLVFEELRKIARREFFRERQNHTLQPTALVNELWFKLEKQRKSSIRHRREFFAVASRLIRNILIDHARRYEADRRKGIHVEFDENLGIFRSADPSMIIALHDALSDLEKVDPDRSRVVELHIFGGLTFPEIGEEMEIARITAFRYWKSAQAWLKRYLSNLPQDEPEEDGS